MVDTVTPLAGNLASLDLAGLLAANPSLVNAFGAPTTATFGVSNNDSELQAGEPAEASIGGAGPVPIDYIGSGQLSFADVSLLLGTVTIQINPVDVGLFTTAGAGGSVQNYLVSDEPLNAANLTASASLLGQELVDLDLTTLVATVNGLLGPLSPGITVNQILNAALIDLDITPGEPFPVTDPVLICFARGTLIRTPDGDRPVEDLAVGDLVLTVGHGPQPIRWIGSQQLSKLMLETHENLRPIRIRAGALGGGTPTSDLIVSPQHRILVRSRIAQKMFGTHEVLVAAKQLLQLAGIDVVDDLDQVQYFHFMFDRHEIVISNGAETEALYTGPEALKTIGLAALEEVHSLFSELASKGFEAFPARPLVSGRMGRRLAVRHLQNRKALVQFP